MGSCKRWPGRPPCGPSLRVRRGPGMPTQSRSRRVCRLRCSRSRVHRIGARHSPDTTQTTAYGAARNASGHLSAVGKLRPNVVFAVSVAREVRRQRPGPRRSTVDRLDALNIEPSIWRADGSRPTIGCLLSRAELRHFCDAVDRRDGRVYRAAGGAWTAGVSVVGPKSESLTTGVVGLVRVGEGAQGDRPGDSGPVGRAGGSAAHLRLPFPQPRWRTGAVDEAVTRRRHHAGR
jgi:hypothetical protein